MWLFPWREKVFCYGEAYKIFVFLISYLKCRQSFLVVRAVDELQYEWQLHFSTYTINIQLDKVNIKKEDIHSQYKPWARRGHVFNGHWDQHCAPVLQQEVGLCPSLVWADPNPKQIRMQIRPEYLTNIQSNRNGTHSYQMDGQGFTKVAYCYVMWYLKQAAAVFGRRATVICLENTQRLRLWGLLARRSSKPTLL